MPKWKKLGEGTYNVAYVSDDGKSVLKIQKSDDKTDTPERSVRLWNIINPNIPPPARLEQTEKGVGWVCPFIKGKQASDKEMSIALIDIYNKTGRIIVDATAPKNFVKLPFPRSRVVCVDVGMAIQMEQRDEVTFRESVRRKSVVSLDTWRKANQAYVPFFQQCQVTNPLTVQTVKALIFIKNNRPDIVDVNFLKKNRVFVTQLANAYDNQNPMDALANLDKITAPVDTKKPTQINKGLAILKEQRPLTLENIRESCKIALQRYVDSRGSIDKGIGEFKPSFRTRWFRNELLTREKVGAIRQLMTDIDRAGSLDEIDAALKTKTTTLFVSKYTSGVETAIARCNAITETARNELKNQLDEQRSLKF